MKPPQQFCKITFKCSWCSTVCSAYISWCLPTPQVKYQKQWQPSVFYLTVFTIQHLILIHSHVLGDANHSSNSLLSPGLQATHSWSIHILLEAWISPIPTSHLHTPSWSGHPTHTSENLHPAAYSQHCQAQAPLWLHALCQEVLGADLEALCGMREQSDLRATGKCSQN